MKDVKILAVVKFNDGEAFVFDRDIEYKYKRVLLTNPVCDLLVGTDGIFYTILKYDRPSPGFYAFAGRKFDIELETGEVINCYGQWWDGGYQAYSNHIGIEFARVTYKFIDDLRKCYVYRGACADLELISILREEYTGKVYDYYEYENLLKKGKRGLCAPRF